ncbi:helix-turn-helix domain-containing protein [Vibrio sp. SCSIO 43137]|uniref:helix-turn-helix domain-containing protein n=1 Tax=Vibrio sp. SCSIO 43137 TaxID=3021011 RepID=UPI0023074596|nr:helix-turn-helix domain-containing protein [Vibrio sp. SCSIO 43137]WCE32132.1 helix-turn-helix domain-containing protein [Vibrio sp. SCSIO 43137]
MDFRIIKPKGKLSGHIQAIWSVRNGTTEHSPVRKPLYCDGGSGVTFLIRGDICLSDTSVNQDIYVQKNSKTTQIIEINENTQLCGIRFHPGMMPDSFSDITAVEADTGSIPSISSLYSLLLSEAKLTSQLTTMYRWCSTHLDLNDPELIKRNQLLSHTEQGKIGEQFQTSQRQIERNFNQWIGMSPKKYQRLRRVHSSLTYLRDNPDTPLSDLALAKGFSDQAHMTREFKSFVLTTPGNISQKIKAKIRSGNSGH